MLPGHPTDKTEASSVIGQLFGWLDAGRKAALAVVVETWGSSPRPAGSLLAVNDQSAFVGSVSGGCVENAVVAEALELMKKDAFKSLHFGVADENAWKVGLACGGEVRVFVAAVTRPWRDTLRGLLDAARDKHPAALVVDLATGAPGLIVPGEKGRGAAKADWLATPAKAALEADKGGIVEGPGGERRFIGAFNPPLRLLVVGAVHIAHSLARIAGDTRASARSRLFIVSRIGPSCGHTPTRRRFWPTVLRFRKLCPAACRRAGVL